MVVSTMLKVVTLAMLVTLCHGKGQDAALTPGSFGADIVNSVVSRIRSKCVFSEDRLFLRRTAYVMSHDGHDSDTYRSGFDGGIWKVTEAMFLQTKTCSSVSEACSNIKSNMSIDWTTVTWSDLRKPLYSGLAVALYTLQTLGSSKMSGDMTSQAILWAQMYNEQSSTFMTEAAKTPLFHCGKKLDLAFILDSSGSVSRPDFELMKNFTASVVDVMNVSSNGVRIADIVYASTVNVEFDFDDYTTKAEVKSKLLSAYKINSGTDTADALDTAKDTLYDYSGSGARQDVTKVAVLVTDGRSSSFTRTKNSAAELKAAGTTTFAIGVGNYNLRELEAVASEPICSHVLTLTSFDQINSIITEIQKSTCEANQKITGGNTTSNETDATLETPAPKPDETVEATVSCGILHIYMSTTDPKPGPAVFDDLYTATPGAPAILRGVETLSQGTPVYITVVGTQLPSSVAALYQCSDFSWTLGVTKKKEVKVICEENGVRRDCKKQDIKDAGFCPNNADLNYTVDNPCTKDNLDKGIMRHSYPYDPTKFLQCDMQGQYYVTLCPGGVIYNPGTRECGFTSPGASPPSGTQESTGGGKTQGSQTYQSVTSAPPAGLASACTSQAAANQQFYHAYAADNTKFIQCDTSGRAYLMTCVTGTVWSQSDYTCIDNTKTIRSGPTTATATTAAAATTAAITTAAPSAPCVHGNFYPNLCEPEKYAQCVHGTLVNMACQPGLHFKVSAAACDWPPANPAPLPASCSSSP